MKEIEGNLGAYFTENVQKKLRKFEASLKEVKHVNYF